MTPHTAFLRAINVGNRRIKMDALRALFEQLPFDDVDTYIASGNVVFTADRAPSDLEAQISAHLEAELGYDVPTFVRTLEDLRRIVATDPFEYEGDDKTKMYVAFLRKPLTAERRASLDDLCSDVDRFVARDAEIYWLRRMEAGESISTGDIEKALDVVATRRTLTTLQRMVKKFG